MVEHVALESHMPETKMAISNIEATEAGAWWCSSKNFWNSSKESLLPDSNFPYLNSKSCNANMPTPLVVALNYPEQHLSQLRGIRPKSGQISLIHQNNQNTKQQLVVSTSIHTKQHPMATAHIQGHSSNKGERWRQHGNWSYQADSFCLFSDTTSSTLSTPISEEEMWPVRPVAATPSSPMLLENTSIISMQSKRIEKPRKHPHPRSAIGTIGAMVDPRDSSPCFWTASLLRWTILRNTIWRICESKNTWRKNT